MKQKILAFVFSGGQWRLAGGGGAGGVDRRLGRVWIE